MANEILATLNGRLVVGKSFTTANSGVKGIVREIVENKSGSYRVRLDVDGMERWTTVVPK